MKKEKTKALFVRVPESWIKKINQIAEDRCTTQASIVRQAIKESLETEQAIKEYKKRKREKREP